MVMMKRMAMKGLILIVIMMMPIMVTVREKWWRYLKIMLNKLMMRMVMIMKSEDEIIGLILIGIMMMPIMVIVREEW
jgi:hypothetical protein